MMTEKFRATRPFIAFGKTPQAGEIVWLTADQSDALRAEGLVEPVEVKVDPPAKKTQAAPEQMVGPAPSARPARASRRRTLHTRLKNLIS